MPLRVNLRGRWNVYELLLGTFGDQPVLARDAVNQASIVTGDRWDGGRFASRAEVRTARREMRAGRDARLAG
jgi:hypothetical protein